MINVFSTVILLFFLIPVDLSFAQDAPKGIKIYSGYLHKYKIQSHGSFWHTLFSRKSSKEEVDHDMQCSLEFKSPVSFSHQSVAVMPGQLAYSLIFKSSAMKEKDAFGKFIIKIYTNDDEEYPIDPDAEGKQVAIDGEHHIFDAYLIYLILGQDIDHIEIVSRSGDSRYVLDKLEIHDNN